MKTGDTLTIDQYSSGWKVEKTIEWKRGKKESRDRDEREYRDVYGDFDAMLLAVTVELSNNG